MSALGTTSIKIPTTDRLNSLPVKNSAMAQWDFISRVLMVSPTWEISGSSAYTNIPTLFPANLFNCLATLSCCSGLKFLPVTFSAVDDSAWEISTAIFASAWCSIATPTMTMTVKTALRTFSRHPLRSGIASTRISPMSPATRIQYPRELRNSWRAIKAVNSLDTCTPPASYYFRRKADDDFIEAAALIAALLVLRYAWRR